MDIEKKDNISEQMMIETLDHLKEEHEKFENENLILKEDLKDFKKSFCSIYGSIRILDMMLNILDEDVPLDIINQVQLLRSFTSDIFDHKILMIKE
jgi:protein involved in sex pheromone biosynthesis